LIGANDGGLLGCRYDHDFQPRICSKTGEPQTRYELTLAPLRTTSR
jgi:hypothetical protein